MEQYNDSHLTLQTSSKESEDENILNRRRGQKRKRLFSSSESESDVEDLSTEIAADGTIWQETEQETWASSSL
ncbi:hypothetical protein TNCV_3122401 [Trichonephila clavipes]|nr:hypothetical protein TNCV_3122401 [Trichonephila clavipes]